MKTHIETVRVDNLFKWLDAVSLKEAISSVNPIVEGSVPVVQCVLLPPLLLSSIASLEFILEILQL